MVTLGRNGPFSSKQVLPVVSSGQPDFCRHLELMGGGGEGKDTLETRLSPRQWEGLV